MKSVLGSSKVLLADGFRILRRVTVLNYTTRAAEHYWASCIGNAAKAILPNRVATNEAFL